MPLGCLLTSRGSSRGAVGSGARQPPAKPRRGHGKGGSGVVKWLLTGRAGESWLHSQHFHRNAQGTSSEQQHRDICLIWGPSPSLKPSSSLLSITALCQRRLGESRVVHFTAWLPKVRVVDVLYMAGPALLRLLRIQNTKISPGKRGGTALRDCLEVPSGAGTAARSSNFLKCSPSNYFDVI